MVRSPILLGAVVGLNTPVANSFDIANKLPNLIYMVIAGGLVNAVLVPAIVKASKNSKDDGETFINKLITLAIVALGGMTIVLTLAAPLIVKMFAATMSSDWYNLTVLFAFWCLPQIFFYGMYTVLGQILNARENFGPYTWAPVLNNIVAIGGLILVLAIFGSEDALSPSSAADWQGSRSMLLAGISTLGIAAQALVLMIPLKKVGVRYKPDFQWRNAGLGDAGRASLWVLATTVVGIFPAMMLSNVAAGATNRALEAGADITQVAGNFAYTSAYAIYGLPTALVTVSITTAMFTRMTRSAVSRQYDSLQRDTSLTLRTVSSFNFLAMAGIIVLAVPLSRVLTPFVTASEVTTLARVLTVLTIGLVPVGAVAVFNKLYYALEDTRGAFFIGLPWQIMGIVGFFACGFLPPEWVVVGVVGVMATTNILAAIVMFVVLRRRLGGLDSARVIRSHSQLALITLIVGVIGWLIMQLIDPARASHNVGIAIFAIIVVGAVMVIAYLGLMRAFKMDESQLFMRIFDKLLRKVKR